MALCRQMVGPVFVVQILSLMCVHLPSVWGVSLYVVTLCRCLFHCMGARRFIFGFFNHPRCVLLHAHVCAHTFSCMLLEPCVRTSWWSQKFCCVASLLPDMFLQFHQWRLSCRVHVFNFGFHFQNWILWGSCHCVFLWRCFPILWNICVVVRLLIDFEVCPECNYIL